MHEPLTADVIVPVYRDTAKTLGCLTSVLKCSGETLHTLIVIDDASPEPGMRAALERLAASDERVRLLRNEHNLGFVATCNLGLAGRSCDAVLLNRDTRVTRGWLRELAEVAHLDERTACVTPVLDNASFGALPHIGESQSEAASDEKVVHAACAGLPRWTEMPAGIGLCLYMCGRVLDLIGGLDPIFEVGSDAESDWAMRAQAMGFVARRANHVFVSSLGSPSCPGDKGEREATSSPLLQDRHPHYLPQVGRFRTSIDCHLAAHAVRVESCGKLRVALDFRHVPPFTVGTSVYAVNLARELSRLHEVELTLIVRQPSQTHGIAARMVHEGQRIDDVEVIHRPAQVFDPGDLQLLFGSPSHLVMTCLDLIAHRVQGIFPDQPAADGYRSTSYLVQQAAQATIAISESAKREIAFEYGIPTGEISVTPLGVYPDQFQIGTTQGRGLRERLGVQDRYFLSVATDFPHKNVENLLLAYGEFRSGWRDDREPPALVLIGNRATARPGAYDRLAGGCPVGVIYCGSVLQEELAALYQGALALVYPSVYEGFGLPLLEAMAIGTPVISLPIASIPEVGGDAILYPDGMAPRDLAAAMRRLCGDQELRQVLIARGQARAECFRWERTAQRTVDVYKSALFRPSERSLRARRYLLEVIPSGRADHLRGRHHRDVPAPEPTPVAPPTPPIGIRVAWKELNRAMRARARRELDRFQLALNTGKRSA